MLLFEKTLSVTLQWFCQMVEKLRELSADYSLPRGTVQQAKEKACPAKTKTPLSSAAWWGWRMCSQVQIWDCNSQQILGLLLISFILALTGLTLWRPLRLPSRPKTGTLYPKYFRGRPVLQFFSFWWINWLLTGWFNFHSDAVHFLIQFTFDRIHIPTTYINMLKCLQPISKGIYITYINTFSFTFTDKAMQTIFIWFVQGFQHFCLLNFPPIHSGWMKLSFVLLTALRNDILIIQQHCVFPETMSWLLWIIHRPHCKYWGDIVFCTQKKTCCCFFINVIFPHTFISPPFYWGDGINLGA